MAKQSRSGREGRQGVHPPGVNWQVIGKQLAEAGGEFAASGCGEFAKFIAGEFARFASRRIA
ncbi:MAG: hypothetical protein VB076_06925 [Synergistaceae bacterium]|nr:hypothetical protein [Synergistaceae bacterium]